MNPVGPRIQVAGILLGIWLAPGAHAGIIFQDNFQLAATHVDKPRGMRDYLDGRWKREVVIAESSAGKTLEGFENFLYPRLVGEYRRLRVKLVDLNEEGETS